MAKQLVGVWRSSKFREVRRRLRRRSVLRSVSTALTWDNSSRRSTIAPKKPAGMMIPVVVSVYNDRSFDFYTKSPPAAVLLKKAGRLGEGFRACRTRRRSARVTRAQIGGDRHARR